MAGGGSTGAAGTDAGATARLHAPNPANRSSKANAFIKMRRMITAQPKHCARRVAMPLVHHLVDSY
jgi:hypothetical protein